MNHNFADSRTQGKALRGFAWKREPVLLQTLRATDFFDDARRC
jgi:hypothetical protein